MCYVTHSLRFTSGATPADLLAAEPSLPHTCEGWFLIWRHLSPVSEKIQIHVRMPTNFDIFWQRMVNLYHMIFNVKTVFVWCNKTVIKICQIYNLFSFSWFFFHILVNTLGIYVKQWYEDKTFALAIQTYQLIWLMSFVYNLTDYG